jgi:hypothetical protein
MKNENYTPYGEEWKKEMKKLPKDMIIDMFAKCIVEKEEKLKTAEMQSDSSFDKNKIEKYKQMNKNEQKPEFNTEKALIIAEVIKSVCEKCEELQAEVNRCYEAMDAKKGING